MSTFSVQRVPAISSGAICVSHNVWVGGCQRRDEGWQQTVARPQNLHRAQLQARRTLQRSGCEAHVSKGARHFVAGGAGVQRVVCAGEHAGQPHVRQLGLPLGASRQEHVATFYWGGTWVRGKGRG